MENRGDKSTYSCLNGISSSRRFRAVMFVIFLFERIDIEKISFWKAFECYCWV